MPDLPYFLKVRFVPRMRDEELTFWYCTSPNSAGRFWPSSSLRRGLGSKVSRCEGPPAMKRKIMDFAGAWPGMCGGLGASGLRLPCGARACSCAIIEAKASEPTPQKQFDQELAAVSVVADVFASYQFTYRKALRLKTSSASSLRRSGSFGFSAR